MSFWTWGPRVHASLKEQELAAKSLEEGKAEQLTCNTQGLGIRKVFSLRESFVVLGFGLGLNP